jgi:5-methylcytosine-specific restriction protein B
MWSDALLAAVLERGYLAEWPKRMREAFKSLFGSPSGRYPVAAEKAVKTRAPEMPESEDGANVPFAALINPENPDSGAYGGMSLVFFPGADDAPSLIAFVVGTNGLAPDENILGRPGHARKVRALCAWLNQKHGKGRLVAWAKREPSRIDVPIPANVAQEFSEYNPAFRRYGGVLYGIYAPRGNESETLEALTAFLDLMFEERGEFPLKQYQSERENLRDQWLKHLMPDLSQDQVVQLLAERRYVILEGPPGTGKTLMARQLIRDRYANRGRTVQFHANTTYENFVGGLAPEHAGDTLGLRFSPQKGFLMEAAEEAGRDGKPYLLHVDEINRADLSKVLGEAIYLLEADEQIPRKLDLPFDFGPPFGRKLSLPKNLHIIGTMNTADRSLAVVDVAIRRRFAFAKLWPQMRVVEQGGCELMRAAFASLVNIFVEHASDEAFDLLPGHSYFLEKDEATARRRLRVTLAPLIEEYLAQGYVASFSEPLRSYLQWIEASESGAS